MLPILIPEETSSDQVFPSQLFRWYSLLTNRPWKVEKKLLFQEVRELITRNSLNHLDSWSLNQNLNQFLTFAICEWLISQPGFPFCQNWCCLGRVSAGWQNAMYSFEDLVIYDVYRSILLKIFWDWDSNEPLKIALSTHELTDLWQKGKHLFFLFFFSDNEQVVVAWQPSSALRNI